MIPAAAPARVRARLAEHSRHFEGPLRVLHTGPEAWYVEVGGLAVGVLSRDAVQVPCGLRTTWSGRDLFAGDDGGEIAYVESGSLWLRGRPLRIGRSVDVRAPRIAPASGTDPASSAASQVHPPASVAELVRSTLSSSVLADGRIEPADVFALVGLGEGLTPLGDDLLCGWLALHRAAGVPTPQIDAAVRAAVAGGATTVLSATLLDCALHGEVIPQYAAWLAALGRPDESLRLAALRAVGATSGAGLAEGARLALLSLHVRDSQLEKVQV